MVLTRAMYRQQQIAEEYAKAPAKVAALTTPGVVSHIASKLDSATDLGALFRLVNDPCYRYELEPIAAREREKRERRLAEERQQGLINELCERVVLMNTPPLMAVKRSVLIVDMYVHLRDHLDLIDTTNDRVRIVLENFRSKGRSLIEDMQANPDFDPEYRVYFENKMSAIVNQIACFC